MAGKTDTSGLLVLAASLILMLLLGTVHAFSVFLEPLESRFNASRSDVSLTYSLALACLTAAVLLGHHIYRRLRPVPLALGICGLAAAGCLLAALGECLATVWLGYSLLFGGANGLGYGFALQISAQANPRFKGLAMGLVTACYGLGAAVAPVPFAYLLEGHGFAGAMTGMAVALMAAAPFIAVLLAKAKAELQVDRPTGAADVTSRRALTAKLWLGYGTAVSAGLMAIGHATGIARAHGLEAWQVLAAPVTIALFNMAGSLFGGWLADRMGVRAMLMAYPAVSALALFFLAASDGGFAVLSGLAVIGFTYGAIIAAYPAAIASLVGAVAGVKVYGRVFTAWGAAGLLAPWFAGLLFERSGGYATALIVAGSAALLSLLAAFTFPHKAQPL